MPGIHALNYVGDDPEQASREVKEASETWETINSLNKEAIKAETSFGRRPNQGENANMKIKDMRALLQNYLKVLGSMKGVRTEWTSVMQPWRQLWNSGDVLSKCPGVIAYILKREALELAKFSKFDTLGEIVCLNKSAWGAQRRDLD